MGSLDDTVSDLAIDILGAITFSIIALKTAYKGY